MALGRVVAVVSVQIIDLGRGGKGGAGRAHQAPVEEHARGGRASAGSEAIEGEGAGDARGLKLARGGGNTQGVEEQKSREMPNLRGEMAELELAGKAPDALESGGSGGIHASGSAH